MVAHGCAATGSVARSGGGSQAAPSIQAREPSAICAGLIGDFSGELAGMIIRPRLRTLAAGCALAAVAGCQTSPPPPPVVIPAAFRPLGVTAPYLLGDVTGGQKARAAKMRAAKIRPLTAYEVGSYMADLDAELRRQTAGIGLDILQVGGSIVIRIPAIFTFDAGRASIKPTTAATLLEIARTVKTRN